MDRPARNQTLRRLLGPGEWEIGCGECFAELDRYVELELAREDADTAVPGMRAHLEGCPACREERESLRGLLEEKGLVSRSSRRKDRRSEDT